MYMRTRMLQNSLWYDTIRYDREFNVDWKAECGQLNLADVTSNKKIKNEEWKQKQTELFCKLKTNRLTILGNLGVYV